jgi:hypothetical protein
MLPSFKRNWKVYDWAKRSNMEFNGAKFQLLRHGRDEALKEATHYLDNTGLIIQDSTCVKDLGVVLSSCGTFTDHINHTVQQATRMSGWVLRTFYTREKLPMLTLYKSLILSRVDYCSALWNPSGSKAQCAKLENVQQAFTRKIEGMTGLNYWQCLKSLRLYSLQRRRERPYMSLRLYMILSQMLD